jgi:hypothetical protein
MSNGSRREGACPTVPLSLVEDYRGHYRQAQITALSFGELRHALYQANLEQWPCFVILMHSFELVHFSDRTGSLRPHSINIARWNKLCAFLEQHRDTFQTVGCMDLDAAQSAYLQTPVRTRAIDTAWRIGEQLISRFM